MILLLSCGFGQHSFSDTEVLNIANKVAEFQRQDSLKTSAIAQQDIIIKRLEYQSEVDSSIIAAKDMHIEILEERVELVKPKWWQNPKIAYIGGMATV
mgnify:FL=1